MSNSSSSPSEIDQDEQDPDNNFEIEYSDPPYKDHVLYRKDWIKICFLAFVFSVAAIANLCVLISISRKIKRRLSPMHKLLLHLCVADIIVVFTIIPSEIAWRISGYWHAGNFMCKAVQFLRAFGLNLSSLILICISLDRYYAIVHPFRSLQASKRVRHMIFWAWFMAVVCAAPQLLIFRLETHTVVAAWQQCLSFWMGRGTEVANTLLQLFVQYFIPLFVILYSYGRILYNISTTTVTVFSETNHVFLRRSGESVIDRARMKTIKLTLVIVIAFIVCWTPYAFIAMWTVVDEKTAKEAINHYVRDILFHMVMANSCANPLLYGIYSKRSGASRRSTSATNTIELHTLNSTYLTRDSLQRTR